MNIIRITDIEDKYHRGFIRPAPPTEITLHSTASHPGTNAKSILTWMKNGGYMGIDKKIGKPKYRRDEYMKGISLFHFIIDRDGTIYQLLDVMRWVYHSCSHNHDATTIGIEHVKLTTDNSDDWTPEQYKASLELCADLYRQFNTINKVTSHDYNSRTYSGLGEKPCPGPINWDLYRDFARDKHIAVLI